MQFEMRLQSAVGVTTGPVVTRNQRRRGGSAATQNFPGELADPDGHQRLGLGKQSGLGPGRSRTGPATGISIGPAGRPAGRPASVTADRRPNRARPGVRRARVRQITAASSPSRTRNVAPAPAPLAASSAGVHAPSRPGLERASGGGCGPTGGGVGGGSGLSLSRRALPRPRTAANGPDRVRAGPSPSRTESEPDRVRAVAVPGDKGGRIRRRRRRRPTVWRPRAAWAVSPGPRSVCGRWGLYRVDTCVAACVESLLQRPMLLKPLLAGGAPSRSL